MKKKKINFEKNRTTFPKYINSYPTIIYAHVMQDIVFSLIIVQHFVTLSDELFRSRILLIDELCWATLYLAHNYCVHTKITQDFRDFISTLYHTHWWPHNDM